MNKEKCKKLLENGIFRAWVDEKDIQVFSNEGEWLDLHANKTDYLSFTSNDYRIKPEPKYIQFTADTAFAAGLHKRKVLFNGVGPYEVFLGENSVSICSCRYSFKEILDHCKFLDTNDPCGTLVEGPE